MTTPTRLVRLTTWGTTQEPCWIDPASVTAIVASGLPACSRIDRGSQPCVLVLGTPEDVHAALFFDLILTLYRRETVEPESGSPEALNCPLVTGLCPCCCEGLPRCPVCNYTKHDAAFEGDHASCPGRIPDEEGEKGSSEAVEQAAQAIRTLSSLPCKVVAVAQAQSDRESDPFAMFGMTRSEQRASNFRSGPSWAELEEAQHQRDGLAERVRELEAQLQRAEVERIDDVADAEEDQALVIAALEESNRDLADALEALMRWVGESNILHSRPSFMVVMAAGSEALRKAGRS